MACAGTAVLSGAMGSLPDPCSIRSLRAPWQPVLQAADRDVINTCPAICEVQSALFLLQSYFQARSVPLCCWPLAPFLSQRTPGSQLSSSLCSPFPTESGQGCFIAGLSWLPNTCSLSGAPGMFKERTSRSPPNPGFCGFSACSCQVQLAILQSLHAEMQNVRQHVCVWGAVSFPILPIHVT